METSSDISAKRLPDRPNVSVAPGPISNDDDLILMAARKAFRYFGLDQAPALVRDSAQPGSPFSVAATGFGLSALVAGVPLGLIDRDGARNRSLHTLRWLDRLCRGSDSAVHHGFFYHFLDDAGRRTWRCELSSIDTALLMAGVLTASAFFDHDTEDEQEIRTIATGLYERVEWPWMLRGDGRLSHGWRPEAVGRPRKGHERDGFLTSTWSGYNESLLLLILALGSPTHPIPPECYDAWSSTLSMTRAWGQEYVHCPPLFTHQFPQSWIDFRGVQDTFGREHGIDWFENSRRATLAQVEYAHQNPHGFAGYSQETWGLSASNGPGCAQPRRLRRDGRILKFLPYAERGLAPPDGVNDDGTLAPWAVAASLPFAPDLCVNGIRAHRAAARTDEDWSSFMASYNPTYVSRRCPEGWVDEWDLAIEQAPIVMMTSNHLFDTIWSLTRRSAPFIRGLRRAGFGGGWLEG